MKEELNSVSFATTEAISGLKKFLKEDKSIIPYKILDVNLYTVVRNVYNHLRPDPNNYTTKDKQMLREMIVTEINYLKNIMTIDVSFYLPKIDRPVKPSNNKKPTKVLLNNINIYDMTKEIARDMKLRVPTRGSVILTNSLAGIIGFKNPILRSFTGDVLFPKEHYKLLKRAPPTIVTKDILEVFGDDLVKGVSGKVKDVNKLLTLIKESPFKLSTNIKTMVRDIIKG